MEKSIDQKVQNFLEELMMHDVDKFNIMQTLRNIVIPNHREINERMMYGGIMFSIGGKDIGGIFPRKKHVSFEFSDGFALEDPDKILEGTGKFRRHLKIKSLNEIKGKEVGFFVKQVLIMD